MRKFKLLVSAALVLAASSVFAVKDVQATIPTGNWFINEGDMFSVPNHVAQTVIGRNIACSLWVTDPTVVQVKINTSNYEFQPGDSEDGTYTVNGSNYIYFYKYNIHALNSNLLSYIRFNNFLQQPNLHGVVINCRYFT